MSLSVKSLPTSIKAVLLIGAAGILVGTLGIRLATELYWVRFFDNLHWTSGTAAAAIVAWLSIKQAAPEDSKGLYWIALGLTGYAIGQILWDIQTAIGYAEFPAPSDLFYLWLGPCITVGLLLEIRNYAAGADKRTLWLDALTLSVAMLTLILVLYLPKRGETPMLPLLVLIAYPATLFVAALTMLTMIPALRLRLRFGLIAFQIAMVATALSWMNWNFMALDGTAIDGSWFNISFSVAVLLLGFSLTQWKMEKNDDPRWDRWCEGALRLLPLITVMLASFAVVLSHTLAGLPFVVQTTADVGSVIVMILAMIRQGALLKERDQLLAMQAALLQSQKDLAHERGLLKSLIGTIPDLIWLKDSAGVYLSCNQRFEKLYGATEQAIIGKSDYDFVSKEQADFFREHDRNAMDAGGSTINEEWLTFASDGYRGLFETIKTPMFDADGKLVGVLGIARDITQRKRLEEESELASRVYQSSSEAIMVTDAGNRIVSVNPAFTAITGYSRDEALGRSPSILKSGRHDAAFYADMWNTLLATGRWQGEIWNCRKDKSIYPEWISMGVIRNLDGSIRNHLALFVDITERKQSEELIWSQANYDQLTLLPNRRLFADRLGQELRKLHRTEHQLALLFIDLDRFKDVNDTLGHQAGDVLLVEAARRISVCVRATDTVARLGGDEFTVILSEITDTTHIDRVAQAIVSSLEVPFILGGNSAYVSASIGITVCPGDGEDVETLLKNADQAMYQSKGEGRNRYSYFTPALQKKAVDRSAMAADLRLALSLKQFRLHFQPIVELSTGRVFKAEALIRWMHPEKGLINPADFIPLAEETGLISDIGDWVFEEAIIWVQRWAELIEFDFQISINKSPIQFQDASTRDYWLQHLNKLGLSGKNINIEITEGLLLEENARVADKLLKFRDAGIQVSIDDFGTGYSALSYLNKFDIDYLKIDQSFIRQLAPDSNDLALSEAIIVMAHRLGLKVVAEGIETEQQRDLLIKAGCDFGQGFIFSKALPPEEFEVYLLNQNPKD